MHVIFEVHHYITSSNQIHKTNGDYLKDDIRRLSCKQLHVNHSLNGLGDFTQSSVLLHGGTMTISAAYRQLLCLIGGKSS